MRSAAVLVHRLLATALLRLVQELVRSLQGVRAHVAGARPRRPTRRREAWTGPLVEHDPREPAGRSGLDREERRALRVTVRILPEERSHPASREIKQGRTPT